MKKIELTSAKKLKRALYKEKATKFRKWISVMAATGIMFSLVYLAKHAYLENAVSRADIILTYPEIAQSKYPDGSRFTYHDFISDENIAEALEIMHKNGKYKYFTVNDLRNQFYLYSYLDGSAGASVSSARSAGNDFSYVANEYKITFIQPHDYKNDNIKEKFLTTNNSTTFLETLIEVNRKRIGEICGGLNGFKELCNVSDAANYDYIEEVNIYKTKIQAIMSYLNYINKQEPGFVSSHDNLTIKDIHGKFSFLITNRLNGISNFIDSPGLSKDTEIASNKLKVNIEDNTLKYKKYSDHSIINNFAMTNYDQTFTENLINVIQNEEYGLYQARPKTAFDTVVTQKHTADENIAEYGTKITIFNDELSKFGIISQAPEEHARLSEKCEKLISEFKTEYNELTKLATSVVTEYYNNTNENYLTAKVTKKSLINKSLIIKMGIVFTAGAVFAFILVVFISSIIDTKKLKKKQQLLKSIKQKNTEEEDA